MFYLIGYVRIFDTERCYVDNPLVKIGNNVKNVRTAGCKASGGFQING